MNGTKLILCVLGCALCACAVSAQSFEGVMRLTTSTGGKVVEADVTVAGPKARITPLGAQASEQYPIFDWTAKKIILVSSKDKYYTEMPLETALKGISKVEMTLSPTGKTQTIQGVDAEEYAAVNKAKGVTVSVWATAALRVEPFFLLGLQQQGGADGESIARAAMMAFEKGLFPLRMECSGKAGAFHWEAAGIDRKKVDPRSFEVPAGYQKLSDYLKKTQKATRGR